MGTMYSLEMLCGRYVCVQTEQSAPWSIFKVQAGFTDMLRVTAKASHNQSICRGRAAQLQLLCAPARALLLAADTCLSVVFRGAHSDKDLMHLQASHRRNCVFPPALRWLHMGCRDCRHQIL